VLFLTLSGSVKNKNKNNNIRINLADADSMIVDIVPEITESLPTKSAHAQGL